MNSIRDDDSTDRDSTIVDAVLLESTFQDRDTMWVFLGDNPDEKVPLRNGQPVSIGRGSGQDICVDDATVSREHLVLTRTDDRVMIEIKGRNGIDLDGKTCLEQTIQCLPPLSFGLGSGWCHLDVDDLSDSTVCISPEGHGTPQNISLPEPVSIEERREPPVETHERPGIPAGKDLPGRDVCPSPPGGGKDARKSSTSGGISSDRGPPRRPGGSVEVLSQLAHKAFGPRSVRGRRESRIWPGGDDWWMKWLPVILCSFLMVLGIILLFQLFPEENVRSGGLQYREEFPGTTAPSAISEKGIVGREPEGEGGETAYHRALLEHAEALTGADNSDAALDYLRDIPESYPLYERARELMDSIGGE